MPCRNCGAGGVGIAGLSGPYLSTPDRRFRADSAFCLRWTLAAQSRQYFARPKWVRKPLPQTSQRRSSFGLRMACSSFGCRGSTARRNHRQSRLLKTYRQMLDELQPDMVVTYSIKPNIYMGTACKAKGIPYVTNVQGLGTAFEKPVLSSVVSVMYRSALRKAKTAFFENEENAQFFLNKKIISHRQVRVLPGAGINLDEYPCVPMGDDGVCSFLFVGRIMKEKGVDEFFSAARTLKAEFGEKVAFDVVGFYEDAYKEQVDQLVADGVVRFHGFQTDVHPFYEAADCVVLPSYHEGMSNVLLEGAATGRALITSDIPGCREAVEDGVSGYLCPAQDAEGLTQAMRDFAQQSFDRQVQMGQNGRALVERKFDKQLVVAQTLGGLDLPAAVRS